jgi:hypothetical protein
MWSCSKLGSLGWAGRTLEFGLGFQVCTTHVGWPLGLMIGMGSKSEISPEASDPARMPNCIAKLLDQLGVTWQVVQPPMMQMSMSINDIRANHLRLPGRLMHHLAAESVASPTNLTLTCTVSAAAMLGKRHTLLTRLAMPSAPHVRLRSESDSGTGLPTLGSSMPCFMRSRDKTCEAHSVQQQTKSTWRHPFDVRGAQVELMQLECARKSSCVGVTAQALATHKCSQITGTAGSDSEEDAAPLPGKAVAITAVHRLVSHRYQLRTSRLGCCELKASSTPH